MTDLRHELQTAVALAEQASEVVLRMRKTAKVHSKAGGEPVTEADLAANVILMEGLARAFPADAILSEETESDPSRLDASRVWILDPIDGTREFIGGTDDFAVQIGLAIDGEAVLGVVHQCARDRLFVASRGGGAWLERPNTQGRPRTRLHVSRETDPRAMRMTVSRWYKSKKQNALRERVRPKEIVPAGGVGIKVALVAMGKADLYLHPSSSMSEWDTCAPGVVVGEAGGVITDLFGKPLRYNAPVPVHPRGLIAANPAAQQRILADIEDVVRGFGWTDGG